MRGLYPVYMVTNVALIPLSSRADAAGAMASARAQVLASDRRRQSADADGAATSGGGTDAEYDTEAEDQPLATGGVASADGGERQREEETIGKDVIGRRGAYGRFTRSWFSKRGWTADRRRAEGLSAVPSTPISAPAPAPTPASASAPVSAPASASASASALAPTPTPTSAPTPAPVPASTPAPASEPPRPAADRTHSLTPKLLRTTKLLLAHSRSFYFSHDWDLTRAWAAQPPRPGQRPLHETVDPLVSWLPHPIPPPPVPVALTGVVLLEPPSAAALHPRQPPRLCAAPHAGLCCPGILVPRAG